MNERTYKLIGEDYPGSRAEDAKNLGIVWMIGFVYVFSLLGLLVSYMFSVFLDSLVLFRFARKQVSSLGKYLSISFVWSCFEWFFMWI